MKIRNFREIKQRSLDRARVTRTNRILGLATLWLILVLAFYILINNLTRPMLDPLSPQGRQLLNQVATQEVKAYETPCDFDAITYIRCRGEQLGHSNRVIKTAIRIARAESNFRPDAKNPKSSATGVFQFLWSTWDAYRCEGEKWDFVDNVNCFYKVYEQQTARYAKKGLIYDFNDWNASRSKWEE